MTALVRALVIWLIVAALPLKAVAAVAMIACDPGHHGAVSAATNASANAAHAHDSPASDAAAAAAHAHHSPDATEADADGAAAAVKCGNCAPCAAAAPAPEAALLPDVAPTAADVEFRATPHAAGVAEIPYKPPRSLLA